MSENKGFGFDDLMSSMGVRRLDGPPRKGRKRRKARRRAQAPESASSVTPQVETPSVETTSAEMPPLETTSAEMTSAETVAADTAIEPAIEQAAAEAAPSARPPEFADSRPAEQARWADEKRAMQTQIDWLTAQNDRIRVEAALDADPTNERASKVLAGRGLRGADEVNFAVAALAEARQLAPLLAHFTVAHPTGAARLLDDRLSLVCADCDPAPGRAALRVPPSRCEACGGRDLARAVRHTIDQFLVFGLTEITFVARRPRVLRHLEALVVHHRLTLRFRPPVPGAVGAPRVAHRALLVSVGEPWAEPPELPDWPRTVAVQGGAIAAVLEATAAALEQADQELSY